MSRIPVNKTYKLYIGGKFPRTESARSLKVCAADGSFLANACHGSKKDIRDAVVAARKAFPDWSKKSAYNRGQILYRIAEILESRKETFLHELMAQTGATKAAANQEISKSIDRLIWYAGWSDKFMQIFSSINPVAGNYWNFTYPDATGVVGIVAPNEAPLLALVSKIAPCIVSGNTCVVIASEKFPLSSISLAEVLVASDVPGGVVNIITGITSELAPHLASHMDVNAVDYSGQDEKLIASLQNLGAENVKRVHIKRTPCKQEWLDDQKAQSPYFIQDLVEYKTAWHPVGV
ncbi:MAG: aldehyde dehydrogenase [Deltaproteobacteria bacterium CG_4_10_14_0_2_um_filter_43_8]|nr:MAG: aldehyde dehydrogenase [Deltaproteobacteria bacterium CG11_big_fil_rev_8_21_14_0_20_42_23]PJA20203.1 MAG: aldehyde dehydrogenase [Deltaproteobacteria bacterium CG_4_10_14_0_2_um_filter_43_8]PJC64330.1 MAG: aldehyde dehydrogenase [Deltaproteobacteria bacterium CG_4_9_14_0_2_um_filter_42_21]